MVLRKLLSMKNLLFFIFVAGVVVYIINVTLVPSLFTNIQKKRASRRNEVKYMLFKKILY